MIKKYIFLIVFPVILLAQFSLTIDARAQELPNVPATIDEAKSLSLRMVTELPGAMILVWKEQVMPIFRNMWQLAQKSLQDAWSKILQILRGELEKRKPDIKKEFQEEKEEMQSDFPKTIDAGKSLWERLKELLE